MIVETTKSIYEMGLHEAIPVQETGDGITMVIRVPGGWLYVIRVDGSGIAQTFVPLNREFDPELRAEKKAFGELMEKKRNNSGMRGVGANYGR